MNLHLLVPGLLWPDNEIPEIYHDLSLAALETLLAKSHYTKNPPLSIEAWLCQAFGVSKQQDWPVAPIMLKIDGTNEMLQAQDEYWLRADPVHLRIENNHILLANSQIFSISLKESTQFADTLNQNFSKDGLLFLPLQPDRWYVRTDKAPRLQTHLLSEVAGKNINQQLPIGEDSRVWHNLFNEIQMLLHDHPLNQAREIRGDLAINSIWFWGGGVMPKHIGACYDQVWSDDPFGRALAVASKIPHQPLFETARAWQQTAKPGHHLVILDSLANKTHYKNIYEWRQCLSSLENNWFKPLFTAIKAGKITQLTITTLNDDGVRNFKLTRSNLWKFWRRTKSLLSYAKN